MAITFIEPPSSQQCDALLTRYHLGNEVSGSRHRRQVARLCQVLEERSLPRPGGKRTPLSASLFASALETLLSDASARGVFVRFPDSGFALMVEKALTQEKVGAPGFPSFPPPMGESWHPNLDDWATLLMLHADEQVRARSLVSARTMRAYRTMVEVASTDFPLIASLMEEQESGKAWEIPTGYSEWNFPRLSSRSPSPSPAPTYRTVVMTDLLAVLTAQQVPRVHSLLASDAPTAFDATLRNLLLSGLTDSSLPYHSIDSSTARLLEWYDTMTSLPTTPPSTTPLPPAFLTVEMLFTPIELVKGLMSTTVEPGTARLLVRLHSLLLPLGLFDERDAVMRSLRDILVLIMDDWDMPDEFLREEVIAFMRAQSDERKDD